MAAHDGVRAQPLARPVHRQPRPRRSKALTPPSRLVHRAYRDRPGAAAPRFPERGFPNVGAVAPLSGGRIWGRTIYASAMVVQFADVLEIRRGWIKRGRPPCNHGLLAAERYLGADTGDDACLDCGEEFLRSDRTPTKDDVSES